MDRLYKPLLLAGIILGTSIFLSGVGYAAKSINLKNQNVSILQSLIMLPGNNSPTTNAIQIHETSRNLDQNKTLHVRVQETYAGYPVWGADAVIHIPNGANQGHLKSILSSSKHPISMNGTIYQGLQADLGRAPLAAVSQVQAKKALETAIATYEKKVARKVTPQNTESNLIVFITDDNKAHWAYKVKFDVPRYKADVMPARPVFILDAENFTVYAEWDDIKTRAKAASLGGGFGGNEKMGKLTYDGLGDNLPKLAILRDADTNICYLQNDKVSVKHYDTRKILTFPCEGVNAEHDNVYWDGDLDAVNGGFSPGNDALFAGAVINNMYKEWYGVPVLLENGKPMKLMMIVHDPIDNAYWDGRQMTFGDGVRIFYPLVSLGVGAHEISHGFTEQHSDLAYYGQSGGLNESFSDMAAQAAEFYAYGINNWQIGPEIFKAENEALRYMDKPSKDCPAGTEPGDWCSIDEVSQYHSGLDVHFSSGIYNRIFYLMGTADGWNTRKAFDVMVQANSNYWTSRVNFREAACGVLSATKDLNYELAAVQNAMKVVGVDTSDC